MNHTEPHLTAQPLVHGVIADDTQDSEPRDGKRVGHVKGSGSRSKAIRGTLAAGLGF